MPRTPTTGLLAYEKIAALVATGVSANKAAAQVGAELDITQSAAAQSYYRYKKMNEAGEAVPAATPVLAPPATETRDEAPATPKRRGRPPKAKVEDATPVVAASNGNGTVSGDTVIDDLDKTMKAIGAYIKQIQTENASLKSELADAKAKADNLAALKEQIAALA